MEYQAVRGMKDIFPGEVERWQAVEALARDFFARFGYQELRLPILEKTELFVRSIGQATDVVEKEMYTFTDLSGDSLTMRPEATAGVCRAYVEHKIYKQPGGWKVCTIGPMFRHERPQKGRFRQFHQINCECLGLKEPEVDVEQIAMLTGFLSECQAGNVTVKLNSLGCPVCRPAHREKLIAFLESHRSVLCGDCQRRMTINPLRVLDCKNPACQEVVANAPASAEHLCDDCTEHFKSVQAGLDNLSVPYDLDDRLVRGLDYYVRTTFEIVSDKLGGQDSVAGGGRYDNLVAELGGPDLPGVGFAIGMERLLLLADLKAPEIKPDVFIAALGEKGRSSAAKWVQYFRIKGVKAAMDLTPKSLKAQMRQANKSGAAWVLPLGEDELERGEARLKNMETGEEEPVTIKPAPEEDNDLAAEILSKVKGR